MNTGCYEIVNTINGQRYVGSAKTIHARFASHRHALRRGEHHSAKLQNAWNKYGEKTFSFNKLLVCSVGMLTFYEQKLLDAYRPHYNILKVARSSLGYKHTPEALAKMRGSKPSIAGKTRGPLSEETKKKISAANKGYVPTKETLEKLKAARAGKTPAKGLRHTAEARAAMSAAHRGVPRPAEAIARGAEKRRGRKTSEETKRKISESNKGKVRSEAFKANASVKLKGRKRAPEAIAKMVATKLARRESKIRKAQDHG